MRPSPAGGPAGIARMSHRSFLFDFLLVLKGKEEVKIQMEDGGIANTRPGDTRSVFAATGQGGVY